MIRGIYCGSPVGGNGHVWCSWEEAKPSARQNLHARNGLFHAVPGLMRSVLCFLDAASSEVESLENVGFCLRLQRPTLF